MGSSSFEPRTGSFHRESIKAYTYLSTALIAFSTQLVSNRMLAEIFAATYPERTRSVVICSSPQYLPQAAQDFLAFGMKSWPEACRKLGSRGWAERLKATGGTMASSDEAYTSWWTGKVATSDGEGLAGYAEFLGKLDARPYLNQIQSPMLILCPTGSSMVKVESMKEVVAAVPNARLEVVESAGHEIYAEAADACIQKIQEFWESLEPKIQD